MRQGCVQLWGRGRQLGVWSPLMMTMKSSAAAGVPRARVGGTDEMHVGAEPAYQECAVKGVDDCAGALAVATAVEGGEIVDQLEV